MKRILAVACSFILVVFLAACNIGGEESSTEVPDSSATIETDSRGQTVADKQIKITSKDGYVIVFALNDSTAANNLYSQLPLSVAVENYGSNEKIFYPPKKLDTDDAPLAKGTTGMLTYYAPWGDVAIYYGDFLGDSGLYELGEAISGKEYISELRDEIKIEAVDLSSDSSAGVDEQSSSITASRTTQSQAGSKTTSSRTQSSTLQTPPPLKIQTPSSKPTNNTTSENNAVKKMNVKVGSSTFTAELASNTAVDAFIEIMKGAPIVIRMSDYSGFEKVGSLGTSLPTSNAHMSTRTGDIVLYNGNQIVMFYGSHAWSYTRIGKIDDLAGWKEALGSGDVTVTFSIT